MSYTQCICKWSVRRLHQAIISFSGISVNDRLTKIWLHKADGGIHFHCQIGISPGSRVLNELSLAYDEERGIRNQLGIGRSIDGQEGSGEDVLCNAEHSMHRHVTTCHSPFSSSQNSTSRLSAALLKGIKGAMLYRKANKE